MALTVIKCKMCGGDLHLEPNCAIAECEYCGSKQTVPLADDEKKLALFDRANTLRAGCAFDKAAGLYEAIVTDFPEEAEAYWGLVLCKFGIEYVDDPATGKKIPTCHRSSFDSVLSDANYEQALEYAYPAARKVYRAEARQIEDIREGIIEVSASEDPYDIFICYKEKDSRGERTPDSVLAQEIYDALTGKGYRVFFSRITMERKLGARYEPYIFAALNSAKIMLVVGMDPSHYQAVWVRNEWSRFLKLIEKGQKKELISCFKGIDPSQMPPEISRLQSQDMGKIGAMQDLLWGIGKIIGKVESPQANTYSFTPQFAPSNYSALLKRGYMALEDTDWVRANEFFEKVLDQDAECGEAYFGQYLVENQLRSADEFINSRLSRTQSARQDELEACERFQGIDEFVNTYMMPGYYEPASIRKLFDFPRKYSSFVKDRKSQLEKEIEFFRANKSLNRASQYARGNFAVTFKKIQESIFSKMNERILIAENDADIQKKKVQQAYEKHIESTKKNVAIDYEKCSRWREKDYHDAVEKFNRAVTSDDFRSLSREFGAFREYRDSKEYAADCREKADKLLQKEREAALLKQEAEEKRRAEEKAETERLRREEETRQAAIRRAEEEARIKQERAAKLKRILLACCTVAFIVAVLIYTIVIVPAQKYQTAQELSLSGRTDEALTIFKELAADNYKDSEEQVNAIYYSEAEQLLNEKKYDQAIEAFAMLENFEDAPLRIQEATYLKAEELELAGDKTAAAMVFYSMGDYNDAQERSKNLWDEYAVRKTIAAGDLHAVCLKSDGTVETAGKYGNGEDNVSDWSNVIAVSASMYYTLGLKEDGSVYAVGDNYYGQCNVSDWSGIVSISAGYFHAVGLKADGTVIATGLNRSSQCAVEQWTDIIAISAGGACTIGLKSDGTVIASGSYPKEVETWSDIIAVDAGYDHVVGLQSNGRVVAAGDNWSGECNVSDWTDIIAVCAGETHTVALKADGTLIATGNNTQKQCKVSSWKDITDISAGGYFTLGLNANGTAIAAGGHKYDSFDVSSWSDVKQPY